ncbi:Protein of unknown function [Gryllus bimaculatus]|nr:Protein of unknown function [Gryllus bimaculatus]
MAATTAKLNSISKECFQQWQHYCEKCASPKETTLRMIGFPTLQTPRPESDLTEVLGSAFTTDPRVSKVESDPCQRHYVYSQLLFPSFQKFLGSPFSAGPEKASFVESQSRYQQAGPAEILRPFQYISEVSEGSEEHGNDSPIPSNTHRLVTLISKLADNHGCVSLQSLYCKLGSNGLYLSRGVLFLPKKIWHMSMICDSQVPYAYWVKSGSYDDMRNSSDTSEIYWKGRRSLQDLCKYDILETPYKSKVRRIIEIIRTVEKLAEISQQEAKAIEKVQEEYLEFMFLMENGNADLLSSTDLSLGPKKTTGELEIRSSLKVVSLDSHTSHSSAAIVEAFLRTGVKLALSLQP